MYQFIGAQEQQLQRIKKCPDESKNTSMEVGGHLANLDTSQHCCWYVPNESPPTSDDIPHVSPSISASGRAKCHCGG